MRLGWDGVGIRKRMIGLSKVKGISNLTLHYRGILINLKVSFPLALVLFLI
jgi:hypothetical protein